MPIRSQKIERINNFIEKMKSVVMFDVVRNNIDINYHVSSDNCIRCNMRVERYPSFGDYSWTAALDYVYSYCKHLKVYKYCKHEVEVFIKSLEKIEFLSNDGVDGWIFIVEPWTEVLQLVLSR